MTNYTSREMMHQNAICRQLHGKRTSINAIERLKNALDEGYFDQVEITLYKKNRSMIWVIMCVAPVENDKHEIPLYLILFYDISPLRQPLDDETLSGSFSKFAKLARSVARNKTVLSQVELDDSLVAVAPIQSNSIPKYRQESPKTPPHVVLHYLTFKTAWDWIIFLLTGYTCIIIPYSVAFGHDTLSEESIYFAVEHIVDIIFFIDIVLNFHTTFVGSSGAVISDPVLIRLNYLKGWFIVDLISSLPFGILAVFSDQTVAPIQSNSIPKYRQESPKTPPHVVLHYLTFKTAWDWIIFLLTGYTCIIIPYSVAFGHDTLSEESIYFAVEHIVDIIFFIDIVLNFHTTFVGSSGAVISDPVLIRLNYLKGWFIVDLISSLPFGILAVFSDQTTLVNLSSILKLARLLRLCRVLRKLDQYLEYVASILLIMLFCFILLAHWLACVWYLIGMHDLKDKIYHGWIIHLMNETTALVYATIFGNVATILQQTHATRARLRQLMSSVKDFLRIHEVPKELAERVIDYVTSSWSITKGVDTQTVLNHCPKDMKADLCVHLYRAVFSEHPAFRLASESCLRALAVSFTVQHNAPGDLIFHQGESIDQLCFVVSGSLEVIQDDEIVAILSKGDIFGQPIFKDTDVGQSAASVRALTYCDLQCIKRDKLIDILKFYSQFAVSFSRTLVLSYNLRNRLIFRKISDVRREQELNELRRSQPPISSLAPDHPVRRLISRFCNATTSNLSRSSSFSSNEPRESGKTSGKSNDTSLSATNPIPETTSSECVPSLTKPKLSWSRLLDVPKTTLSTQTTIKITTTTTMATTTTTLTTNTHQSITINNETIKQTKQHDDKIQLSTKYSNAFIINKLNNQDIIEGEQEKFHKTIMQHIELLRNNFLTNIRTLSSRIDLIDQRITRITQFINHHHHNNNQEMKGL
uniref:Potassium voltage-gated channel protein eag n=1 Tax=Schistosoma haematobium TaxID=6185 RepID=A0A094ZVA5_SCHHA